MSREGQRNRLAKTSSIVYRVPFKNQRAVCWYFCCLSVYSRPVRVRSVSCVHSTRRDCAGARNLMFCIHGKMFGPVCKQAVRERRSTFLCCGNCCVSFNAEALTFALFLRKRNDHVVTSAKLLPPLNTERALAQQSPRSSFASLS